MIFTSIILDVDGVFTDGKFHYTADGKLMKTFGDADSDALSLLSRFISIEMITGDKRGFAITHRRIAEDMGYQLSLVSTFERAKWIGERKNLAKTIYMGDGIFDSLVFEQVGYGIAPANAFPLTRSKASFVTNAKGGEGAVAEACVHVMEKFFGKTIEQVIHEKIDESGSWRREE